MRELLRALADQLSRNTGGHMPGIRITTSAQRPESRATDELLGSLSKLLAREFGKPEQWVMTCLAPRPPMKLNGTGLVWVQSGWRVTEIDVSLCTCGEQYVCESTTTS
jgi:hypothetical protein